MPPAALPLICCVTLGKSLPHSECPFPQNKRFGLGDTLMFLPAPSVQFHPFLKRDGVSTGRFGRGRGPLPFVDTWAGGEGRRSNGKQIFSRDGSKHRCWHGRAVELLN